MVTIDPAKRLADSLGIGELSNTPTVIDGPWDGTLAALMLDTESTFDEVGRRHARDDAQADRILGNRFYKNVSGTLSGTQDYMAVEKLSELSSSGEWDLIVVDTPPTRDALAFLEAPKLLTRLLDNPIYKVVTASNKGLIGVANRAAQGVLRQLARVVGAAVVDEAVAFFQAFQGMEDGFRDRPNRPSSSSATTAPRSCSSLRPAATPSTRPAISLTGSEPPTSMPRAWWSTACCLPPASARNGRR